MQLFPVISLELKTYKLQFDVQYSIRKKITFKTIETYIKIVALKNNNIISSKTTQTFILHDTINSIFYY